MADLPTSGPPAENGEGIASDQDTSGFTSDARAGDRLTDQTLGEIDQTLSDSDQSASDSDQTSAERDQYAADRDQAASDRDLAHGLDPLAYRFSREIRQRSAREREQTASARLATARRRDETALARDLAALARDHAASARDLAMAQHDAAHEQLDGTLGLTDGEIIVRAAAQRERAAAHRAQAAAQRDLAAGDRLAAAGDREQAAADREHALRDREELARQLAISETDPLTGARTRGPGLSDLERELDRCRRANGLLVVAYVDVVGLKAVNDRNGHLAGDDLLKRVVAVIRAHLRSYDLIVRLGGDEFLCAMSSMTLPDARQRFAEVGHELAGSPGGGAIRTGYAQLNPEETVAQLIARADEQLIDPPARRPGPQRS
jgi:diguanylate cyclase (GGDEF)-like protein